MNTIEYYYVRAFYETSVGALYDRSVITTRTPVSGRARGWRQKRLSVRPALSARAANSVGLGTAIGSVFDDDDGTVFPCAFQSSVGRPSRNSQSVVTGARVAYVRFVFAVRQRSRRKR